MGDIISMKSGFMSRIIENLVKNAIKKNKGINLYDMRINELTVAKPDKSKDVVRVKIDGYVELSEANMIKLFNDLSK